MTEHTPKVKKSRIWLWLTLIGFCCLLFALQKLGVKSVYREENARWVDPHSPEVQNRVMTERREEAPNPEVDRTMEMIDQQYGGEIYSDIKTEKGSKLSSDARHFYSLVKQRYAQKDALRDQEKWLQVVKASYLTYTKVKSVFAESAQQNGEEFDENNISRLLQDSVLAVTIYKQLRNQFGLSESQLRDFAAKGKNGVSDWADFVDGRGK